MLTESTEVYLNRFPVHQLDDSQRNVWVYTCNFEQSPEPEAIYRAMGKVLWAIKTPGTRFGTSIATQKGLTSAQLQGDGWALQLVQQQVLDPTNANERVALEQIARRWLEQQLRNVETRRVERAAGGGLIWWKPWKAAYAGDGWQVHSGVHLDVSVDVKGLLYLEIDSHYRFRTPWSLQEWLENYPEAPIEYVHNTYDEHSWKFVRVSEELPETMLIPELGITLADYHRQKQASEAEIEGSRVVYVKSSKWSRQNAEVAHLTRRLQPSISMEVLSYLSEHGQPEAAKVFKSVRQLVKDRLQQGSEIATWLLQKVYRLEVKSVTPQLVEGFRLAAEPLLAKQGTVARPEVALRKGCFRTGELRFGCLDLTGAGAWSPLIKEQLVIVAAASEVAVDLDTIKQKQDLPDRDLARRQFWNSLAQDDVRTLLVVTPWLGDANKTKLRREALQAGIALQFMLPMLRPDKYRAANITLGLLVKAGWQPVGVKMLEHPQTAELAIGFDAGTNRDLFYGTSAFAVLADGQSLGWEIPEAQVGERFSGAAIWQAVLSIVSRFEQMTDRKPQRLLLMRDGFVRENEFNLAIHELEAEGIAVDLVEIHKSGAGRMAILPLEQSYQDAPPGVAVPLDSNRFRLITSQARAGGSARPLEVVKLHGDAPLGLLAIELFRLSQFHPASGFVPSRLPMPLHYADRMIKEVQRLGQLGVLHGVNRQKIFAA